VIALVTARSARHLDDDLSALTAALMRVDLEHRIEAWDDASVRWESYELAVVRSTWDYPTRFRDFVGWIDDVATRTRLLNPPDVLRWSTDKHYLADLAAAGVPVVPTTYVEPGDDIVIPDGDHVLKPAVGVGAADCLRIADDNKRDAIAHIERLLDSGRAVMLQPYIGGVDDYGETGLVYIDGEFSHAVRKGAILESAPQMVEDLYAREDITPRTPSAAERSVADKALAAVAGRPLLYARVDVVPGPEGPLVLELELCEPSLFLAFGDGAADRLAAAIGDRRVPSIASPP
jgi:glutathione synthase/RimK-type ligase-like ATP-grasp enzyme